MRGQSGRTSLPIFVALGYLLREIIATSGSYYGVTGPNTGQLAYLPATLSPEAMALRRNIALLACVAQRAEHVCHVSSLWVTYFREIIATLRLLLWGNGANTSQLAYLRRHFHRKRWQLRRHIALLACVAHRAEQVCLVSSLWVTYSER
ncbi:hypothetical protein DPMN_092414 [Dreissena polymorpha]|uniref:Uncharacterized protein n=1 Tax=Dreissena polymorpha TaxID=45954 RepID=A0A9D4L2D5_DREPO|nr:hypothetical protein DPMN_092414 [Dreissena polymorpha]